MPNPVRTLYNWHPESVEVLSNMWLLGHTSRAIAAELSKKYSRAITRNMVIGKANRLGLRPRNPQQYSRYATVKYKKQ